MPCIQGMQELKMWLRQCSLEFCALNSGHDYLQFVPINSSTGIYFQCCGTESLKLGGREKTALPYRIVYKYFSVACNLGVKQFYAFF